ncbi:MAG: type II CAAX endopeptidase family protein [Acidobacteriaceae bacterium]
MTGEMRAPRVPGGWIFWGPQGLRTGWAVLVYGVLLYLLPQLVAPLIFTVLSPNWQGGLSPSAGFGIKLAEFVAVLAATFLFAAFERRPLTSYGFRGHARTVRMLSGLLWGFICISALVLALWKLRFLSLTGGTVTGGAAAFYAAKWGGVFLLTGFTEEAMFRGYPQFKLTHGVGFWWGALLLALIFGLAHSGNGGESWIGLVAAGAVGLVFCLSLWYTGSLWWAVGFHAAWDWGQSYFYGTADSGTLVRGHLLRSKPAGSVWWSGGVTGPEGSVLIFPLLALIALGMVLWWGRRGERPFRGNGWTAGKLLD